MNNVNNVNNVNNILRSLEKYPLNTFIRTDSPQINEEYMAFLNYTNSSLFKKYMDKVSWSVPEEFCGRNQWRGIISPVKDQGSCGGCFAFAATSALSDLYNLRTQGLQLDLSATRIIMCDLVGTEALYASDPNMERRENARAVSSFGCSGNTLIEAWRYLFIIGTNTTECFPNRSVFNKKSSCTKITSKDYDSCMNGNPAVFYKTSHIYAIPGIPSEGGSELEIRKHIYKFGPVTSAMAIYEDFYKFNPSKKIYFRKPNANRIFGHAVVIDGWGVENGVPFWWIRNSWGVNWGIEGYFKIVRGQNHCGIEENVMIGIPASVMEGDITGELQFFLFSDLHFLSENKRIIESVLTSSGGIDKKTGISRRMLSYQKNAKYIKNLPKSSFNDDNFIAGNIGLQVVDITRNYNYNRFFIKFFIIIYILWIFILLIK